METDRNIGLGKSLRSMRRMSKLTLDELGAKVGLSGSSVGAIERGKQPLTPETMQALCTAMGYQVHVRFSKVAP